MLYIRYMLSELVIADSKLFFLNISYHKKICDVHQQNLSYNKDVVRDVELHGAPLMDPREAVRQWDFYQTKVKASQQLQINQIIDKVSFC